MLVFLAGGFSVVGGDAIAQVIPDPTLSSESSNVNIVTTDGSSTYRITGGASRGGNLFHSFERFSVLAGDTAEFVNASTVENIISRVTGGNLSTLDGTIRAGGSANLFLINPAGIVIGPNARLDIGGSFVASTGDRLLFEDGLIYGVDGAEVPSLLTISAPIGINLGNTPGNITVVGDSVSPTLSVAEGRTLALIGGEVSLTATRLTAPAGRIEIGSVGEASELSLTSDAQGFDVGFEGVTEFGDIQISGQSVVDASGTAGGAIALHGRAVTLTDQSALISDTLGDQDGLGIWVVADSVRLLDSSYIGATTLGSGAASSIAVTAAEDIEVIGTGIPNYKQVEFGILLGVRQVSDRQIGGITATTMADGRAGDISLMAQRVLLNEGVLMSTETFGTGDSGDINIIAVESLHMRGSGIFAGSRVLGIPLIGPDGIATGLSRIGVPAGGGGIIEVATTQLTIEDGASIIGGTYSDQDSGDISIRATDAVILRGSFAPFFVPTSITIASLGGRGNAGNLSIETGHLLVQEGALINTDSGVRTLVGNIEFGGNAGDITILATESVDVFGGVLNLFGIFGSTAIRSRTSTEGNAGTIQITTPILNILNGGRITSETQGQASGGAININAQNVLISGAGNDDPDAISGIFANSGVETQVAFITGEIESVPASGTGGSITIDTANLTMQDRAVITVGSFDSGAAGNLAITADVIRISGGGRLIATTTSDGGGNIILTSDTLALDNGSITASSDSGDGGNLTFNVGNLLLLRNGSLISTEAGTAGAGGNGGDITLNLPDGFIVAVPTENSDIRANAFEGDGGNVNVTARSLIGIAFRPNVLDTPLSDITASSRFGNSGTVIINELAPDVFQDNATLPTETAPPALAQGCRARGSEIGSFVSTGRGGLPTNPVDPLSADTIWQDLEPIFDHGESDRPSAPLPETTTPDVPIVEAQSWTRTEEGTVILLAEATAAPDFFVPMGCELE
ncbi:MAG: filamentous hemagglutinin N-terminal domain-containing protein [Elainellaceae cyanobacterium]